MTQRRLTILISITILLASILASISTGLAQSEPDQRTAVTQAVTWLVQTHQNEDGGYGSFSAGAGISPSDIGGTLDAMIAISSAGYTPAAPLPGAQQTPLDYLQQHLEDVLAYAAADGGSAAKLVLGLIAANQNPYQFAGEDFVAVLNSHLTETGQFNIIDPFGQSLAIMALAAAGEPVPESAVQWLLDLQASEEAIDGSWDDGFGTVGNPDATGMVVMALVASGLPRDDVRLVRAADFLARSQLETGGWEYGPGFGQNVNSTALAVQALAALGQDFYATDSSLAPDGITPLQALLSFQGESGAFQIDFGDGPTDDFFSTVQAIPALMGKAYPINGRFLAAQRAVTCLRTMQDPTTGGWEQFATFGVDAAGTSRAIQAIAAVGQDPADEAWAVNGITPVQALADLTPAYLEFSRGGGIGIVMQGVVAAGGDVHDFAGEDLVLRMTEVLSPTGEYDHTNFGPFAHAEAMIGLLAAGEMVDETAVDWLLNAHTEGDWGGPDSSGLALNALGRLGLTVPEAVAVLHTTQTADGGWGFDSANPSSSAEVVQGLVQVGENPFAPAWSQIVSGTVTNAADAVLAQQGENGCWPNLFGEGDDPFSTTDAIMLLVQQPAWAAADIEKAPTADPTAEPTLAPTAEPTAAPTQEPTTEPTLEPTAPPTAAPTEPPTTEATAVAATDPDPTAAPTEAPATAPEAVEADTSSPLPFVLGGILLLLIGGIAWFFRQNRTAS